VTRLKIGVAAESLKLTTPFRIAGHVFDDCDVVCVTLDDGTHQGRGEASGVYYFGDDAAHMMAEIERVRGAIERGADRSDLRSILPPGGARNAVDCAMWDLEAARAGMPVWKLAGLPEPRALVTTFSLGADAPDDMAMKASALVDARSIKIKLTGHVELDIARVRAIRAARPDVWLSVDGNQGFERGDLDILIPALVEQTVSLLEQPLARGDEAALEGLNSSIPIAGDESVISLDDVAAAHGRFDVINIKLDKCGGLTEALLMVAAARELEMAIMVGCMVGTSLGTAPSFLLGQLCDLVDLDGPMFLSQDRAPSVVYREGTLFAHGDIWGGR